MVHHGIGHTQNFKGLSNAKELMRSALPLLGGHKSWNQSATFLTEFLGRGYALSPLAEV